MKVLYMVSWYPRPRSRYSGIYFRQLAEAMAEITNEVIVACVHVKFAAKIDRMGLSVKKRGNLTEYIWFVPAVVPRWKWMYKQLAAFYMRRLYKRIVRRHGVPDIIHAQSAFYAGYAAAAVSRKAGVPMVFTEHSSKVLNKKLSADEKRILAAAIGTARRVIAVSHVLKGRMASYGKAVAVVPNLVDTAALHHVGKKPSDMFTFMCLGNLLRDKGMDLLIRAFCGAFAPHEKVRLVIGGEGVYRSQLERLIQELECGARVTLCGAVEHKEIGNFMSLGDCFALTSRYETFGIVFIEAASCGLPLISTRCGGPEEIINAQNGILIEKDDGAALIQAMRYMASHTQQYSGNEISKDIKNRFGKDFVVGVLLKLYRDVLEDMRHKQIT